jgi:hypothetical protein
VELIHDDASDLLILKTYVGIIGQEIELPLRAVDDHVLRTEGKGRLMGETIIYRQRNGAEFLDYSGLQLMRTTAP